MDINSLLTILKIDDLSVTGILLLGVIYLALKLKDQKEIRETLKTNTQAITQLSEFNKIYKSYCENMINNIEKREDKTLEIQERILDEIKYNREFYKKQLDEFNKNREAGNATPL